MAESTKINCLRCRHYAVTWNPALPHACKLLGFKSASMPSVGAYNATGEPCKGFEPKSADTADNSKNRKTTAGATLRNPQGVIVTINNSGNKERK